MVVARVATATDADVRDAVAAAHAAFPRWSAVPWQERAAILDRAADIVRERRFELAAWLIFEMGKNRVEALGEIEETADLYAYYAAEMRANAGYVREMGRLVPTDTNTSVLRPYGVWAVIAPWNFPYALLGRAGRGGAGRGQHRRHEAVVRDAAVGRQAGRDLRAGRACRPGVISCLPGSGRVVGDGLRDHPDVAGLTFTGSYDVGFGQLYRKFAHDYPKPCVVEMGGKNPAIVMPSADIAQAVQGVLPLRVRHERAQVLRLFAGLRPPRGRRRRSWPAW